MKSFSFDGIKKDWVYMLKGRSKPPFAAIARNAVTITGRHGAFLQSSSTQPMIISQPIAFKVFSDAESLALKDELAGWLVTDDPRSLKFDDEPDREYFAIVQNTLDDFERFVQLRQGTIEFLLLDPFGYGVEVEQNLSVDPVVVHHGTAEARPIFEIDVLKQISHVEIRNNSLEDRQGAAPSIVLGQAVRIDEEEKLSEELVFHDTMQSTASWTTAIEVDNGHIAGTIEVDEKGFFPATYGNVIEPKNWQGASLLRGIGQPLQDFRADIYIENLNTEAQTGMLDVYFRDENGNVIGKIGFGDAWTGKKENFGHGQVGSYAAGNRVDAYADNAAGWNNFNGMIRITLEDAGRTMIDYICSRSRPFK
jgi:predicted phage tail component-like protein